MGSALRLLAVDLEFTVHRFPLFLGLVLGFISAWLAHRRRALRLALRLLPEGSEERRLIEQLHRSGPILEVLRSRRPASASATRSDSSLLALESAVLCLAGWIWVAVAAWPLFGWERAGAAVTMLFTGLGALALLIGQGLRFQFLRSLTVPDW